MIDERIEYDVATRRLEELKNDIGFLQVEVSDQIEDWDDESMNSSAGKEKKRQIELSRTIRKDIASLMSKISELESLDY